MAKDTGGLSVGERIARVEEEADAESRHSQEERARMWAAIDMMKEKINKLEVELGKSNTKLAILMTVLFSVVTFAARALFG